MEVLKLVVHSIDNEMKTAILSEKQVNLNQSHELDSYIIRLTKSLMNSVSSSDGILKEESFLTAMIAQPFDFMATSLQLAKEWFDTYSASTAYTSCNLIFALISDEAAQRYAMFEVMTRSGFLKVNEENDNTIVYNGSILSDSFSGVKAAFSLDMETGDLRLKHTADNREYLEELLNAETIPNAKRSFEILDAVIDYISEKREEDSLINSVKAKQFANETAELFDEVETMSIIQSVFTTLEEEESGFVKDSFDANNMSEMLDSKEINRIGARKKHRIKTESGIEITIPIDSLQVDEVLEINENNGRVSVVLKNVGKIV